MRFKEKIANYILGNIPAGEFPKVALQALQEGIESESILILSSMSATDNIFELNHYFKASLLELNYLMPSKHQSAMIMLRYYLQVISTIPDLAFSTMTLIHNEIYMACDWKEELDSPNTDFLGSELGLEQLYTWYRELQDLQDGSRSFYYSDLPRMERHKKFIQHLVEEAKTLCDKIDT